MIVRVHRCTANLAPEPLLSPPGTAPALFITLLTLQLKYSTVTWFGVLALPSTGLLYLFQRILRQTTSRYLFVIHVALLGSLLTFLTLLALRLQGLP